jgi:hypothetical protein
MNDSNYMLGVPPQNMAKENFRDIKGANLNIDRAHIQS